MVALWTGKPHGALLVRNSALSITDPRQEYTLMLLSFLLADK